MRVGPARERSGHFGAGSDGPIHSKCSECAKEGTVKKRPPARVKNTRRPSRTGDEIPQTYIRLVGDSSVFPRAVDHLRLHPKRTSFGLGMPERFTSRSAPHQI